MSPAFSDLRPDHLLIRALGEERAARHAESDVAREAHEALARSYRERLARLGHAGVHRR